MECKRETFCANIMSISEFILGKQEFWKGFNRWTRINFQCTMLWINCKRWIQFSQIFFSPCSYHAVQAWVAILATSVALHSTPVSLSVGRSLRLAELWGLQSCCFFSLTSFTYFTHVRAYPCPKTSLLCWVYKSINLILVPQLWQLLLEAESSFLSRICRALEFLLNFVYTNVDWHFDLLCRICAICLSFGQLYPQ